MPLMADHDSCGASDPRSRNEIPEANTVQEYLDAYSRKLSEALSKVSSQSLQAAFELLEKTVRSSKRIYVGGNGGSSAIADHLCCDWTKGTYLPDTPTLRTYSLTANAALSTALSNDFSFEQALSRQIEMYGDEGDVAILISSSGNSPNILKAAEAAHWKKMTVVGLTGFDGGKLSKTADISLHVPVKNYGIAEDAHQSLMHVLAQFLARKRDLGA